MKKRLALDRILFCKFFVSVVFLLCIMPACALGPLDVNDEPASVAIFLIGKSERFERIKREYMSRLSPGGKALLLANRRDYALAIEQLKKCPRADSASADYVRAFCLEGLGRHKESIAAYQKAAAKVDLTFNPSSMFYLHFAIPYFESGDYKNSLKYINIAVKKAREENRGKTNGRTSVLFVAQRLIPVIEERTGQYRKALDSYTEIFGKEQFHFDKPIKSTNTQQSGAKEWLGTKKLPEKTTEQNAYAYYLKSAKSYLSLGNFNAARVVLLKAVALEKTPLTVSDKRFGDLKVQVDFLGKGVSIAPSSVAKPRPETSEHNKDMVNVCMANVYLHEKNYAECCKWIRRMLKIPPWHVHQIFAHVIRMRDVAQLVTQQDVDVHSEDLEVRMESSPLLQLAPLKSKEIEQAYDKSVASPLLDKAGRLAEQGRFRECMSFMDAVIREKKNLPPPETLVEYQARYQLGSVALYSVELLRIGVAYAAESKDAVLSFANFGRMDNKSRRIWQPVEDQLLGRPARIGEVDEETRTVFPRMIAYENFAAGVHSLKDGNYKDAAKSFAKVYVCPPAQRDPVYSVFAKALEVHCKNR